MRSVTATPAIAALALIALVALLSLGSLGSLAACGPKTTGPTGLTHNDSWCPDGFEVGPQDTCFAIPEHHDKTTPILVYLHGMYAGHGSAEEWALVHGATRRGFAVIVPRGRRGLCAWKAELKDHFCWPQEVDDPASFKQVVAEWDRVLWQVDALLEGGSHKRYVLGYSNGGGFASYLARHGLFAAQAYAIVNGGPLEPAGKPTKPAALLLLSAQDDAEQAPKMKELHEGLTRAGAGHAFCARPGAHALAADDVEASLRFFKQDAEGKGAAFACESGGKPAAPPQAPAAPSALPAASALAPAGL
jgi:poly(3-hydroxybutyrate) depolymerase